jgi:hypothetical protein
MEIELGALDMEEAFTRGELVDVNVAYEAAALVDWEPIDLAYLEDLRGGIESVVDEPELEEDRQAVFQLRRRAVLNLVERVDIGKDRKMSVVFKLDMVSMLGLDSAAVGELTQLQANRSAGTYTHTQSSPLRRQSAACA